MPVVDLSGERPSEPDHLLVQIRQLVRNGLGFKLGNILLPGAPESRALDRNPGIGQQSSGEPPESRLGRGNVDRIFCNRAGGLCGNDSAMSYVALGNLVGLVESVKRKTPRVERDDRGRGREGKIQGL